MRILHVIPSISPASGGPSTAMWNTLEAMRRCNVEFELATIRDANEPDYRRSMPYQLRASALHFFPRQTTFYTASMPLYRWLNSNVTRFDVVHTHGLFSFAPTLAARIARQSGIPYIMRPAGVLNHWGRSQRKPVLKRVSLKLIEQPLLNGASAIHFTSPIEVEEAKDLCLRSPSSLIPLGIDVQTMETASSNTNANVKRAGTLNVLFLSRLDPVKRLEILLRSVAELVPQLPQLTLTIAGDGDPAYVESLRSLSGELGLESKVHWLGFVAGEEKRNLFAQCDVFVLPSASENFGMVVVEAMAAGKPVVATSGVGIAWLLDYCRAGIVIDTSVEQLSIAMSRLLKDPELRSEMGIAGHRAVQSVLSLEAVGEQLQTLYRSVAKTPHVKG